MKLGIMQPYFMPYLGYWQLMSAVDVFVIYDDGHYRPRGWINRNRVLINGKPSYITVPLSNASPNVLIKDVSVSQETQFKDKIIKTLECSYSRADHFRDTMDLIEPTVRSDESNLVTYLMKGINEIKSYLGIDTKIVFSSEIPKRNDMGVVEKIIDICNYFGADKYYNAIGGRELYFQEDFENENIELSFLKMGDIVYSQPCKEFVPQLSIIDILMFNERHDVIKMLEEYELIKG